MFTLIDKISTFKLLSIPIIHNYLQYTFSIMQYVGPYRKNISFLSYIL
jgi:hypothetical protein